MKVIEKVALIYYPEHVVHVLHNTLTYKHHEDVRIVIYDNEGTLHAVRIQVNPVPTVTITPFIRKKKQGETND